jgi:gamma-glutamyltranspeptidase
MLILRQTYFQNFLSVLAFMLIICYYAFNGIPEESFEKQSYSVEKASEYENSVEFEKNANQLRAAILMDADVVQIKGLLYQLEVAVANLSSEQEAKTQVQKIYDLLLKANKKAAIKSINQLRTYLLKKTKVVA